QAGDKLKGFIIDLRNNPGGLLDQAITVSESFMDRGEIVSTRGRNADSTQRFLARGSDMTRAKPLIVLINGGSASASEIVAGESSLLGHLKGDGQEETGSQSYVPLDPRNDKALNAALDLMRGIKINPAFPPTPVRGAAN